MKKLLQKNRVKSVVLSVVMTAFSAVAVAAGITVKVETPDNTPQCYINGTISDNKWVIMDKVDGNHFTKNFPAATEIGWGYQFSWNTSFDDANAAPSGDIKVKPDENGIIDVKVFDWKTTPDHFGIVLSSGNVIIGNRSADTPDGYKAQWEMLGVRLIAGETFMLYNVQKDVAWVGGIEGESGITVGNDVYTVAETGKYDLYLKLEEGNDMLYAEFAKGIVWRVAGDPMLTGYQWDPTADVNKMTEQADGTFKLVKTNVNIKSRKEEYEFKFAANGNWDMKVPVDDSNYSIPIPKDGSYTLRFTLDPDKKKGNAIAEYSGDIEYKYTQYKTWQVMTDWNGGNWTVKDMKSKGSGVFTVDGQWGTGSGVNVYSGYNVVKQDWYPAGDVNLSVADGLNVGDDVTITLTVVNDDTIKLKVLPKSSTSSSLTDADRPYVLRYRNLIGSVVPADYKGVKLAEMSDGSTIKVQ